jgi:hypothetical protein
LEALPWRSKYVLDDDVIRYVSLENFKYEPYAAGGEGAEAVAVAADGEREVKAGRDVAEEVLSVLVHTSVPYGVARRDLLRYCSLQGGADVSLTEEARADLEQQKHEVISLIVASVTKAGALPFLASRTPQEVRLLGWDHSQINRNYHADGIGTPVESATGRGVLSDRAFDGESAPAALVLPLVEGKMTPVLVLAGDAFTESNFDGCVKSARHAAHAIVALLSQSV